MKSFLRASINCHEINIILLLREYSSIWEVRLIKHLQSPLQVHRSWPPYPGFPWIPSERVCDQLPYSDWPSYFWWVHPQLCYLSVLVSGNKKWCRSKHYWLYCICICQIMQLIFTWYNIVLYYWNNIMLLAFILIGYLLVIDVI